MKNPPLRRPLLHSRRAELAMAALGAALTLGGPVTGPVDLAPPGTAPALLTRERLLVPAGPSPVLEIRDLRTWSPVPSARHTSVAEPPSAR